MPATLFRRCLLTLLLMLTRYDIVDAYFAMPYDIFHYYYLLIHIFAIIAG